MSNLRPIPLGNLRPAPATLTPAVVERFLALADQLGTHSNLSPRDVPPSPPQVAPLAMSMLPLVAAEEARSRHTQGEKPVSTEQKIVDAMRRAEGPRWTMKSLAHAAGISAAEARDAVQKMRWSGKMQFDRLELSASMLAQAAPEAIAAPEEMAEAPAPVVPEAVLPVFVGVDLATGPDMSVEHVIEPAIVVASPSPAPKPVSVEYPAPVEAPLPDRARTFGRHYRDLSRKGDDAFEHSRRAAVDPVVAAAFVGVQDAAKAIVGVAKEEVRPSIAAQVAAEAEAAGRRRRTAGFSAPRAILDTKPTSVAEAVAIGMVEDLEDAMLVAKRAWPDQLARIVMHARRTGQRPGVVLAAAVEAGLNSFVVTR